MSSFLFPPLPLFSLHERGGEFYGSTVKDLSNNFRFFNFSLEQVNLNRYYSFFIFFMSDFFIYFFIESMLVIKSR